MSKYQILTDNADALKAAQKKARNGEKLTREDSKLLAIEADRLQDVALTRALNRG